jgi:hypothetical protein
MAEELLGTIARLQVQREALKQGTAPHRWYQPDNLVAVSAVRLDADGAVGLTEDGAEVIDVHNARHARCRDQRGTRGVSVMAVADYEHLRDRHGAHLTDGVAGETITLAGGPALRGRDLGAGLVVETRGGRVPLVQVRAAAPCVEFTSYVLRRPRGAGVDDAVLATLETLDDGARGFVCAAGAKGTIALGDAVYLSAA